MPPIGPRPPWWRPFARRRWDRTPGDAIGLPGRIAALVDRELGELGLVVTGECSGSELRLSDRLLPLRHSFRDFPADEGVILRGARDMTAAIAREHGPGRIWTFPLIGAVHLVYDDGRFVMYQGGEPRVRLRAAYYHEACRAPEPSP